MQTSLGSRLFRLTAGSVLTLALLTVCCSKESGNTEPEAEAVVVAGSLVFPSDAVSLPQVTVGFGDHDCTPDATGAFAVQGDPETPGLALASGPDAAPMLMAIVPDPRDATSVVMDARSTALALAFLSPFVCTSDRADAATVLAVLEDLPEVDDLAALLEASLASDPLALATADEAVDSALTQVVDAYIRAYPELVARAYPSAPGQTATAPVSAQIVVDPSYTVSGHQVTTLGDERFALTNARGRWAYCVAPQGDFFIFPNGSLLDALRGRMWTASQREFEIDLEEIEADTAYVYVYGLGWSSEPDNLYDDLSNLEVDHVIRAGGATVLFEFVPQMISVVTNSSKTFLSAEIANREIKLLLDFIKYGRIGDRTREYLQAGDYCGLVWFLCKETVSKIVHDDNFRAAYLETVGLTLSDKAFQRLAGWVLLPARVVLISDSMTSALKTAYGFATTRFRTTFKIYEVLGQEVEVGCVQGSVHDQETGLPIEGATVELLGDDANPLSPPHQVVTSSSGGYFFSNILTGEKTVRAGKSGYATASIDVTIVKDQTVTGALIELQQATGTASGLVLDEILQRNGVLDPRFTKELVLTAREVGGEQRTYSYRIGDGDYYIGLGSGTWWIAGSHADYYPDSVQVTVAQSQAAAAPRAIVMKPRGMLEGWIYVDMSNDGTYESQTAFAAVDPGVLRFQPDWPCPSGGPRELLELIGASATGGDVIMLYLDPEALTGAGDHALGGADVTGCSGFYPPASAMLFSRRFSCQNPVYGNEGDMIFLIQSDPDFAPCNCGVAAYGSLTLDECGTQLTDVIDGLLVAHLAGSTTCACTCCEDLDGDGQVDDWVVGCARARVEVHFRVLVGSLEEG